MATVNYCNQQSDYVSKILTEKRKVSPVLLREYWILLLFTLIYILHRRRVLIGSFIVFQAKKPLMEKMRRARINDSLNELKSLILEALNKDVRSININVVGELFVIMRRINQGRLWFENIY